MSVANILPAVALLGGIVVIGGSATMRAVLPSPPPIEIHSLSYDRGYVTQEHTIRSNDEAALLTWGAQLIDHETGNPIPGCTGSDVWPFEVGRRVSVVTLDQWVGALSCLPGILPTGTYHLRVIYTWDGGTASARSEPFEISR